MARNLLVINVALRETRVALIENGVIAELQIERARARNTVGNIVLGKVTRVLPGMQAAFIDVGMDRAAFLHVEDLIRPHDFETYLAGAAQALERKMEYVNHSNAENSAAHDAEEDWAEGAEPIAAQGEPTEAAAHAYHEHSSVGHSYAPIAEENDDEELLGASGEDDEDEGYSHDEDSEDHEDDSESDEDSEDHEDHEDSEDDDSESDEYSEDHDGSEDGEDSEDHEDDDDDAAHASAEEEFEDSDEFDEPHVEYTDLQDSAEFEEDRLTDDEQDAGESDEDEERRAWHDEEFDEPVATYVVESEPPPALAKPKPVLITPRGGRGAQPTRMRRSRSIAPPPPAEAEESLDTRGNTSESESRSDAGYDDHRSSRRRRGRRPGRATVSAEKSRGGNGPNDKRRSAQGQSQGGQRQKPNDRRDRGKRDRHSNKTDARGGQLADRGAHLGDRSGNTPARVSRSVPITEVVREGDQVVVQISKEPIGTKGARVTSHISLPGRHVVYLPTVDHIGISKRIGSFRERQRLRKAIDAVKPPTGGLIVRTVAEGLTKKHLKEDVGYLLKLWAQVAKKRESAKSPEVLYEELDLVLKVARDLFTDEIEKIVIDDKDEYARLVRFVEMFMPNRVKDVELYTGSDPIFDAYGIEDEIGRALSRKVPLPSGGYLILDQAEALTAIDVNTGRYVGKGSKDLEETALKTNLEAVDEIAYQLRFRNIGGLVILDLIDMENPKNRDAVWRALEQRLEKDKAKTTLNRISELGLIEMTRKRTRESLGRTMHEPCHYCDGTGQIMSRTTIAYEILRQIRRELSALPGYSVHVNAHPAIVDLLKTEEKDAVIEAERRYMRRIEFTPRREYHIEQFDLTGK